MKTEKHLSTHEYQYNGYPNMQGINYLPKVV